MEGIDYSAFKEQVARMIESDPTAIKFHAKDDSWEATGRLAVAGSRTFGRTGQSVQLMASELTGSQMHVLVVPHDTRQPSPADEVRTVRRGVTQRFNVIQCLPTPWKVDIVLDEVT